MGKYFKIRGKQLYTDILGEEYLPKLLFIHGGPGGVGSADFIKYQGDKLSNKFRVIAPDQRGVWRSEAISENEEITLEEIIEDYEELRKVLGIKRWSILSHSFGGYLAVLYANTYPESVECMVYESPSFDFSLSERGMLKAAIQSLKVTGEIEKAEEYYYKMNETHDYRKINSYLMEVLVALKESSEDCLWYNPKSNEIQAIARGMENGLELWQKSSYTRGKLLGDWRVYQDVFRKLENIQKPSLLIKGQYDPITCERHIEVFLDKGKMREVMRFEASGHYVRIEEADKYSEVVTSYIYSQLG